MAGYIYPATFREDDGEVLVRVIDLPEVVTSGADIHEARDQAADALEEAMLYRLSAGEHLPIPSPIQPGQEGVALDPLTAGRVHVARTMEEERISQVALAAAAGVDPRIVRRVLDGSGNVTMATVSRLLQALGVRQMSVMEFDLDPEASRRKRWRLFNQLTAEMHANPRRSALTGQFLEQRRAARAKVAAEG